MSEIDWFHVEDLAEAALRADVSIISGHDYGCGFRAGYIAGRAEARCTCPHISDVDGECPEHGRGS